MRIRNGLWRGVSTLFLLLALATAAFAVTEAEVAYIKGKVEQGLTFSRADLDLAERINAESDSYIDVATAWGQFKGTPQNEQPRTPRRPLDVYVVNEAAMDWFDIVDLGSAVPLGDDAQTQIVLPFQFTFYDVTYSMRGSIQWLLGVRYEPVQQPGQCHDSVGDGIPMARSSCSG